MKTTIFFNNFEAFVKRGAIYTGIFIVMLLTVIVIAKIVGYT